MKIKSMFALIAFVLFICCFLGFVSKAAGAETNKLDPHLSFILAQLNQKNQLLHKPSEKSLLSVTTYVNVLIKTTLSKSELEQRDIVVQSQFGNIFTATIPISEIENVIKLPDIVYVQKSKSVSVDNDVSMPEIQAPQARQQYHVSGKGVLIGIVDTGIDWRHDDFRNPDGTTRIKALLDFSDPGDVNGDGFLDGPDHYGGTLYTEEEINKALSGIGTVNEKDLVGHGTHTAGSAAGNGRATGNGISANTYVGVAPQAELVIVKGTRQQGSQQLQQVDYLNGVYFIDSFAISQNKPCVINLSLGNLSGSHDGKDLSEQAIDERLLMSASVKAVVISAGNDGDKPVHASGTFGGGITSIETKMNVPTFTPTVSNFNDFIQLDGWYKANYSLSIKIIAPTGNTYGPVHSGQENGYDTQDGAVYIFNAKGGANPLNGDKQILIQLYDYYESKPPKSGDWKIVVTGAAGRFDLWLSEATMEAEISSNLDHTMIVGTPGTAFYAITVGSYNTKKQWVDLDGNSLIINSLILNDISAFSSPGPTRDGRIKPEISAPGQMIAASYSSDASPSSQYSMFKSANKQFPSAYISQDNKHALSQGTSFAAPHVSGTIALILELKPNKTMEQIREAIFSSARSDNFTSDQNKWGYGKLATLNALLTVSVKDFLIANQTIKSSQLLQNYPNPFNTETNIVYSIEGNQLVNLAICNQLGQKIKTLVTAQQALGYYKILWDGKNDDGEHVPSGIYFCRLKTETFSKTKKLILLQ